MKVDFAQLIQACPGCAIIGQRPSVQNDDFHGSFVSRDVILNRLSPSSVAKDRLPSPCRCLDIDPVERRVVLTKCREISNNTTRTLQRRRRQCLGESRSAAVPREAGQVSGRPRDVSRVGPLEAGMSDSPSATVSPAEKVKQFPTGPGIYLMKDARGG